MPHAFLSFCGPDSRRVGFGLYPTRFFRPVFFGFGFSLFDYGSRGVFNRFFLANCRPIRIFADQNFSFTCRVGCAFAFRRVIRFVALRPDRVRNAWVAGTNRRHAG